MRHAFRSIALSLAIFALGTLVLHSGHMDAAHLQNAAHPCGLCQIATSADVPVLAVSAPLTFDASPVFVIGTIVSGVELISGDDARGPPLA